MPPVDVKVAEQPSVDVKVAEQPPFDVKVADSVSGHLLTLR